MVEDVVAFHEELQMSALSKRKVLRNAEVQVIDWL